MDINYEYSKIYETIASYFGNPIMVKGKTTPPDRLNRQYSIYYAKLGCLLCIEDQYLVAVVHEDGMKIGNRERLRNLSWVSFQTRKFPVPPAVGIKTQETTKITTNDILENVILTQRLEDRYIYETQSSPVRVELLLDEDNDKYSETGNLKSCLETYMCVITFLM